MSNLRAERCSDNSTSTTSHDNNDREVDWLCCACNMDLHSEENIWGLMVSVITNGFTPYVLDQIQSLLNFLHIPILSGYAKDVPHFPVLLNLMTFHQPSGATLWGMVSSNSSTTFLERL